MNAPYAAPLNVPWVFTRLQPPNVSCGETVFVDVVSRGTICRRPATVLEPLHRGAAFALELASRRPGIRGCRVVRNLSQIYP